MELTAKMLAGYWKARREWITVNDAYNISAYGITHSQYNAINRALNDEYGICIPSRVSLVKVNHLLADR